MWLYTKQRKNFMKVYASYLRFKLKRINVGQKKKKKTQKNKQINKCYYRIRIKHENFIYS